jgi:hypothetical protein
MRDPDTAGPKAGSRRAVFLALAFALVAHGFLILAVSLTRHPF